MASGEAGERVTKVRKVSAPCLHGHLTPSKNAGNQGQDELPWLVILCRCCYTSLLEELSAVHTTPLGKDNWKLEPTLSWTLPYASFTFTGSYLCAFSVVNHNHEYNSFPEFCESF